MTVPGYSFLSLLKSDLHKARREQILPWPEAAERQSISSISPDQASLLDFAMPWNPELSGANAYPWLNVSGRAIRGVVPG